jgi:hypothetical protein
VLPLGLSKLNQSFITALYSGAGIKFVSFPTIVVMAKFVVNRLDTDPGMPPAFIEGSFDPSDHEIRTEGDLVRRIYMTYSDGVYSVTSTLGDQGQKLLWRGEIEVEDSDSLLYSAEENLLESLTSISVPEKPSTGVLKRVDRPMKMKREG